MRILAIDWSGKAKRAEEHIWVAGVRDGRLDELWNGRSRAELCDELVRRARTEARTVVGIDFAFSFPRWWCDANGWTDVRAVWAAAAARGDEWLESCEPPFWGRPGKPNPHAVQRRFRRTDRGGAKSVFQIGGAGAVGTGSIRGMPLLRELSEAGFAIWPFDGGELPRVVEIYPRALTGRVDKGRWRSRRDHLIGRFGDQDPALIERAAGSEDAFDAAVSALVMARHEDELAKLAADADPHYRIEGRIWTPPG